ncbi:MAG: DUF1292 domain-containing protein [Erysipelotrichaceae bacterium]|nr:DUF1292 domain-containing protein [Erysipelotrichaceae bacterium]MDY5251842.1 DUF1292 domain-containing protein [Erysipelotrichaceae bacterium]
MQDNRMLVTLEDGTVQEMEILFTFDDDATNQSYVLFTTLDEDSDEVFAAKYSEEGDLDMDLTAEEMAMCEEVLGAFSDEQED